MRVHCFYYAEFWGCRLDMIRYIDNLGLWVCLLCLKGSQRNWTSKTEQYKLTILESTENHGEPMSRHGILGRNYLATAGFTQLGWPFEALDLKKQQLSSPPEFSPELCVLCAVWFMDSWMHCGTHFALGYDGFIFDLRLVQGYREVRFVKLSTQLVLLQLLVV